MLYFSGSTYILRKNPGCKLNLICIRVFTGHEKVQFDMRFFQKAHTKLRFSCTFLHFVQKFFSKAEKFLNQGDCIVSFTMKSETIHFGEATQARFARGWELLSEGRRQARRGQMAFGAIFNWG